jgi:hypothetical protein
MHGKQLFWKAAGAFAIIMIAGCGAGTPSSVVATAPEAIATAPAPTTPDKYESARYCQQLMSGAWVTNSLHSTTRCVPDPSYATGDEAVDRSHVIPRCFTCKLSAWTAAEQAKAHQWSAPPRYPASAGTAHHSDWSPERRVQVIDTCTSSWGADETLCDCVVNHVAYQVPATAASSLSPDDARLEAAADECNEARKPP